MVIGAKSFSSELSATDQAAVWFARQRTGPWSQADAAEFAAWLKADPSHTAAWASFERLWGHLETVRDDPKLLAIRERARGNLARHQALRRTWRVSAVIAASLVVVVSVWWNVRQGPMPPARPPSLAQAKPGALPALALIRDVSTDIGERSLLVLADGSKVTLNTMSAVHADYMGRERRVTLVRGEAFFDVARDSTRPFIVTAGARQIIAVGTAFDVRLQDRQVKVTLVEGRVRIVRAADPTAGVTQPAQPASTVMLEAGSALVTQEGGADQVRHFDAARATSWRTGKLVFDGERLADVVDEMNRYSREKLVIGDPALEGRKVSGVFEPTSGPAFAKALEAYGIARATQKTATTIVLDSPQ
jgi:transmembrane sensor